MQPTFKFDQAKHIYTLDGKPLHGVTTVLSIVAKPALIQWSANEAVTYIKNSLDEEGVFLPDVDWKTVLKEAKTAHRRKKEDAGQKGTNVHAEIEQYIKLMIADQGGVAHKMNEEKSEQVQKFIDWAVDKKVKFLSSEQQMFSATHWLAGTADFTCILDGKKYIGDLKTSSGIYYEYWMQTAAYRMMLEEMGEKDYHGSIIVRCGKDGSFEVKEHFDFETDKDAFLGALTLFKAKQLYEVQ